MKNPFTRKTFNCEFCNKRVKRGIANWLKHIEKFHTGKVPFSVTTTADNMPIDKAFEGMTIERSNGNKSVIKTDIL